MKKSRDPPAIAISAIENVSLIPVTRDDIRRMVSTVDGEPSHIMALYSDVSYAVLLRLAIVFGISDDDFARGYIHARDTYAAVNPDFDAFVLEMEAVWEAPRASISTDEVPSARRSRAGAAGGRPAALLFADAAHCPSRLLGSERIIFSIAGRRGCSGPT
jgi:hypothetical protein